MLEIYPFGKQIFLTVFSLEERLVYNYLMILVPPTRREIICLYVVQYEGIGVLRYTTYQ